MTPRFWLWLIYFILLVGGGWYGWSGRGTNRWWFWAPLLVAIFVFIICWIIAGNPLTVLVR